MVDALRAEVAGLTDRLSRVESVAAATAASVARADMAAMEARLAPMSLNGTAPSTSGVPDAIAEGSPILSRLAADGSLSSYLPGRIDAFFGRANMLQDPTLEQMYDTTTLGTSFGDVGALWEAKRASTGAGTPSATVQGYNDDRVDGTSGRSSGHLQANIVWGAATGSAVTAEVRVQPSVITYVPDTAPWLVTSCRVGWLPTYLATRSIAGTVRLAIVDGSGTEVATSDPVPLEVGDEFQEVLLSAALAAPGGDYFKPQVVVELSAASIAGATSFGIGVSEWQMHESDTEDPASFTPAIGSWSPSRIVTMGDPDLPFVTSVDRSSHGGWFEVYPSGGMAFYDPATGTVIEATDPTGASWPFPMHRSVVADLSSNSTSASNIFTFPVRSGQVYAFHLTLAYDVTSASQGLSLGFRHPGGAAIANIVVETDATSGAASRAHAAGSTGATDYMGTPASSVADTNRKVATMDGHYRATADGTFNFRFARAGASSSPGVTIVEGSMGLIIAGLL